MSMQVKLAREHVESENICAVEACGAKSRHTYARKLHEISVWDDVEVFSMFVPVCFLCAFNTASRERIERRRCVKLDGIDGNEEHFAEIDATNRGETGEEYVQSDMTCEGEGKYTGEPVRERLESELFYCVCETLGERSCPCCL